MSRGFLAGAGWGTVVAGLGLVVASQVTELSPEALENVPPAVAVANAPSVAPNAAPITAAPDAAQGTDAPQPPQVAPPLLTQSEPVSDPAPALSTTADAVEVGSRPPALEPDQTATAPISPSEPETGPDTQTDIASPDVPGTYIVAPNAPAATTAVLGDAPRTAAELPAGGGTDGAPSGEKSVPPAPEIIAESAPAAPDVAPDAAEQQPMPAPESDVVIVDIAPAVPETVVPNAPEIETATDVLPPVLRPAAGFGGKVDGVKTGRLPSIGSANAADTETADASPTANVETGESNSQPPIVQFARAFENAANKPLFAILLQDTGGPDIDREALAAMPFAVSFVIDPTLPDAATAAQIYRAGGQEVLMLGSGIPAGATASDLAVSFEATAAVLPESVGIVDIEQGGFQGNRTLATEVLALVQDQGRGVISWDRGLNAASQVARREGIRNAVIFRAIDNADEKSPIIRRYLDRAAFKAAQDGRVVVAGKTRPETVAALLEWAVEGRSATVAIAPASAVMTSQ